MPLNDQNAVVQQLHPWARPRALALVLRIEDELGLGLTALDAYRDLNAQAAARAAGASRLSFGWHNLLLPGGSPASLALHLQIRRQGPAGGYVGFGPGGLEPAGAARVTVAGWWEDGSDANLTARELVYASLDTVAREEGCRVGGRFKTLQDWCHVEFHPPGWEPEAVQEYLSAHAVLPWEAAA